MKQPTIPAGTNTFDPLMRDPTLSSFYSLPHRGEHGWLVRSSLKCSHRERWEMGMWDVHLYLHSQLHLYCVVAHLDGVEQHVQLLDAVPQMEVRLINHDHETLTEARCCFADWARYAAIEQATRVLEL